MDPDGGNHYPIVATRCRVEDCLAVALRALTRPRIPLRVAGYPEREITLEGLSRMTGNCHVRF